MAFHTPQPVYPDYFADPFVWRHEDVYYAVGTGAADAEGVAREHVFPLLRSPDLRSWHFIGHAMARLPASLGQNYWAPEVAFSEGTFYLYYSVGHGDKHHQLRVAVSSKPEGPYVDAGKPLIHPASCAFAIDASPFRDANGRWYLFYARDFLNTVAGARVGTGLMVAVLKSMTELEDEGTVVMRARHDWQRFEANRLIYGHRYDWHTLEGPSVVYHDDQYYCFYSAGRWEDETYGVDYAVADQVLGPYSNAGSEEGPRVLHTLPGCLIGPGHNSVTTGPDGRDYIVYHAWDTGRKARRMHIEPLVWGPDGPRVERPGADLGSSLQFKVP